MSDVIEIAVTSDTSGVPYTCSVWDVRTGTNLMNYKGGGGSSQKSLKFIRNEFIVSGNLSKPLLHIWPVNNQEQIQNSRFVLPGRATCLDISPDGNYCVAGVAETIYVWQIKTGILLAALLKHYQTVSSLKFTTDGSHIISGGQDGMVIVWNLTNIIARALYTQPEPLYTFSNHALPVTDIFVGSGGMKAILCSVSLDRTCKIYDLSSGELLLNLVFEWAISSVTIDILESNVYIGTIHGAIYEFKINPPPRTKEFHLKKSDCKNVFQGHKKSITTLSISLDGEILMSGSEDANVLIWHIPSKQLIRTIPHKSPITNAFFITTPKCMFDQEIKLNLIANNFQRMIDNSGEIDQNIVEVLINKETFNNKKYKNYSLSLTTDNVGKNQSDSKEITELKNEVNNLKNINRNLLNFHVNKVLNKNK